MHYNGLVNELRAAISTGQTLEVSNSVGDVWSFVVKTHLDGEGLLCELLDENDPPLSADSDDLKISVPHKNGVYEIPARIIASDETKREYRFQLEKEYHVIQRRNFYRLPKPRVFVSCMINDKPVKTIAVADIGGGGIGLLLEREVDIKKGAAITLEIAFPDRSTITANGRVMRAQKQSEPNIFHLGVLFVKIAKVDRTKIVSFVFNNQLERSDKNKERKKPGPGNDMFTL